MTYFPRVQSLGRGHLPPRMTVVLSPFGSGLFGPPAGPPEAVQALATQAQENHVRRASSSYNSGRGWRAKKKT